MKKPYPVVLTVPYAHKDEQKPDRSVGFKAHELETLFHMSCDLSNDMAAGKMDDRGVDAINGYIHDMREKTGYCYHGIVSMAWRCHIVREENGKVIRGWEVLPDGTYRLKP